jgi:hypothetical protein
LELAAKQSQSSSNNNEVIDIATNPRTVTASSNDMVTEPVNENSISTATEQDIENTPSDTTTSNHIDYSDQIKRSELLYSELFKTYPNLSTTGVFLYVDANNKLLSANDTDNLKFYNHVIKMIALDDNVF